MFKRMANDRIESSSSYYICLHSLIMLNASFMENLNLKRIFVVCLGLVLMQRETGSCARTIHLFVCLIVVDE